METSSTAYPDPRYFGVSSVTGRRSANEDAWAAPPAAQRGADGACYVVADGVGGQSRGDLAAQTAVEATLRIYYERAATGDDPPTALGRAVAAANHEVYQLSRKLGIEQMGCTLVAAAIGGGRLYVAHVGDARAQLLQGGQLFPLTRDHTWVQEQVDRGTITPEDAARHEFRHIVTRVLGNDAQVDIAFSAPITPGPDDLLILSSDGLHDVMPVERIARVAAGAPPPAAAQALTAEALDLGSEDNVTVMIVAVGAVATAGRPSTASGRVPTVRIQRTPPAATPTAARRRGSFWPAVLLAAVGVLAVVGLVAMLSRDDTADVVPTAAIPPTAPFAATDDPATMLGTAAPTSTAAPMAYPPAGGAANFPVMCMADDAYLWEVDDPDRDLCYDTDKTVDSGVRVHRLEDAVEKMGQTGGGVCDPYQFVRVRTLEGPPLEGWVLADRVVSCRD